jgi:Leucine-rich repeat (LRR) protein
MYAPSHTGDMITDCSNQSFAQFIRQHEKALANSLQLQVSRRQQSATSSTTSLSSITSSHSTASSISSSTLANAFSFSGLSFRSHRTAHLTLSPHHLYYLLSQIEELDIAVGPMNVRVETLQSESSAGNYVSFLQDRPRRARTDRDSIHSVSSMRSVMSGMTTFWSSLGLGNGSSKSEKARAAIESDLKYLYSAFTKIPTLRLTADHHSRLIRGYEEFPFDSAVPLFAFKNLQQLDIVDLDFRQLYGWDRLAENLVLLTIKRGQVDDPSEVLTDVVLDDMEKRRRRSTKNGRSSPTLTSSWTMPSTPRAEYALSNSDPGSPADGSPPKDDGQNMTKDRLIIAGSVSPKRPTPSRPIYRHVRSYSTKVKRSESDSSNSSDYSPRTYRNESVSNLLSMNVLPASKWQRLKSLSLSDNSLLTMTAQSLAPVANTLRSLNLSLNLFSEIPDSLASLIRLASLDLSGCMIDSLNSLTRSPLPAITTLRLKSNRLSSLAGIEKLLSLEVLDIRDNYLTDPMEIARLTGLPNLRRIYVKRNPFVKAYPGYRITMFNLFRSTPGYIEDMIIDDGGPGYSERKLLVDRVPETEHRTSERLIRIAESPVVAQEAEVGAGRLAPAAEIISASTRRRRAPRRRIVDLAQDNSPQRGISEPTVVTRASIESRRSPRVTTERPAPTPVTVVPKVGSLEDNQIDNVEVVEVTPEQKDEYRAKVEGLRLQYGPNWLSALGGQDWHNGQVEFAAREHLTNASNIHRSNSLNAIIVNGGRTLG